jgi:hypothetical protein
MRIDTISRNQFNCEGFARFVVDLDAIKQSCSDLGSTNV